MQNRLSRFLDKFSQKIIIQPEERKLSKRFEAWLKEKSIIADYSSFEESKNLKPFDSLIIWEFPSQEDLFLSDISRFILNNIEYIGAYINKSLIQALEKEIYRGILRPIGYFSDNSRTYPCNFCFLKIGQFKIENYNPLSNLLNKELEIFIPEQFKKDNFIFFTLINQDYLDYFLNFHEILRKFNIEKEFLPITIDTKSHIFLLKKGIFNLFFDTSYRYHKHTKNKKGNWVLLMFIKLTLNYIFLKSGYFILYCDADIIFKKNPLPKIKHYLEKYELVVQNDRMWYSPEDFNIICAGFMAAKPTEKTLQLLNPSKIEFKDFKDDQTYINNTYSKFNLKILFLPISEYPNGSHYYYSPYLYEKTAYIIHFNYCIGDVRRWKMIEGGYWVIKEFSNIERLFYIYNKLKKKNNKIIYNMILKTNSLFKLLYQNRFLKRIIEKTFPPLKIVERNLNELNKFIYS